MGIIEMRGVCDLCDEVSPVKDIYKRKEHIGKWCKPCRAERRLEYMRVYMKHRYWNKEGAREAQQSRSREQYRRKNENITDSQS